jgi:hypothetical protein
MSKVLPSLMVALLAVLAVEAARAQGGPGQGQGMGRGAAQGQGQGLGRGPGQGAGQGTPQRGEGQGQYQGDMFTLIQRPAVQRELKLAPEQVGKLRALGETDVAQQAARMLADRGSCDKTAERRQVMAQVRDDIREILNDAQWKRLNEVWVQVRGVRALQSERVAADLELTAQQKRRIGQLLTGGFRGNAAELEAETLAVLTEDQRKQFRAMWGEPFAMLDRAGAAGAPGGGAGSQPRDGRGRGRQ